MTASAIVLVPGLFGFDSFGSGTERIAYFDQVAARLAEFTGFPEARIVVHKPPPVGALIWRVKSLYDFMEQLLRTGLPGGPVTRVHLVGHSTGGVDVRLLTNPRFSWPRAPTATERSAFLEKIGTVVSISAPHHGTPIARRLRGAFEKVVPEIYLLSILAKCGTLDLRKQLTLVYMSLVQLLKADGPSPTSLAMADLPPTAAVEVARFLSNIVDDRALIHDLTPLSMRRLNASLDGGDWPRLRYYVTTSPPPRAVTAGLGLQGLQWAAYASAYKLTSPSSGENQPLPEAPWIGTSPLAREVAALGASDGVVPSAAQLPAGAAHGIVLGDHLDVVGHFASRRFRGTTTFKSGSGFDDARFDCFWRTVAGDVRAAET